MAADAAGWATASSSPGRRSCWAEGERGGEREEELVVVEEADREWGRDCGSGTGIPGSGTGAETETETASDAGATAGVAANVPFAGARVCRATPCCCGNESLALSAGEVEVLNLLDSLARPMAGRLRRGEFA